VVPSAVNSSDQFTLIGIGVGSGAALITLMLIIILLVIVARRHNRKRSANDNNNPDAIVDSWSIPRPHPLVWQSNSTMTSSMMRYALHHGNGEVHRDTLSVVEMQARFIKGPASHAPRPDDVTAELDRVIAEHETSSDLTSRDQWTSGRHSGATFAIPRLLRLDTNMHDLLADHQETAGPGLPDVTEIRKSLGMQFALTSGENNGGEINYYRPSRVPADGTSRDVQVPPEIKEFVVRRDLSDETAENIDNDVMRGPEPLRHMTSVSDHRPFDEESFSEVLTYYGSTGNLQVGNNIITDL